MFGTAPRRERGYKEWVEYDRYTDYVAPLVLLALNTGLRRGELLQLRWRDLDLQRRMLTVRGEGAKTRQTRHVPLNSEATRLLKAWRPTVSEPEWCVFGGSTESTPLVAVKKAWRGILKSANMTWPQTGGRDRRRRRPARLRAIAGGEGRLSVPGRSTGRGAFRIQGCGRADPQRAGKGISPPTG